MIEQVRLGKTDINVSKLSFGAAPLGGAYGDFTQKDADTAVRTALDYGITTFDTSPYYGKGRSEEVLGQALKGINRDAFTVITKCGRYDVASFDFSADRVRRSVDESLSRLKLDHIDLLLCHDIEFDNPETVIFETLPALRDVVKAGKVRALGVSGLPLGIFRTVLDETPLDAILSYSHACLNDDSLVEMMPYFNDKNVGVIAASPLSMGLLTHAGPPDWHPATAELREAVSRAVHYCEGRDLDLSDIAISWSYRLAGPASLLVGMNNPATVHANVKAVQREYDPDTLHKVRSYFDDVQRLSWPSGRWGDPEPARLP